MIPPARIIALCSASGVSCAVQMQMKRHVLGAFSRRAVKVAAPCLFRASVSCAMCQRELWRADRHKPVSRPLAGTARCRCCGSVLSPEAFRPKPRCEAGTREFLRSVRELITSQVVTLSHTSPFLEAHPHTLSCPPLPQ
eukprot:1696250-Rhodomonas_salina.1